MTHPDEVAALADESLTGIERVRCALAMLDAGYDSRPDIEDIEELLQAYDRLTAASPGDDYTVADQITGQIEERFPNWRSYRDLIDCIDCTLHDLRSVDPRFAPAEKAGDDPETLIAKAPDVLKRLGERLTHLLDDDNWNNIEPMLLTLAKICAATPALRSAAHGGGTDDLCHCSWGCVGATNCRRTATKSDGVCLSSLPSGENEPLVTPASAPSDTMYGEYTPVTVRASSRPSDPAQEPEAVAALTYTNWRGETSVRQIIPQSVRFASTEWHSVPQWLLLAYDIEKQADREFALKDFGPRPVSLNREALARCLYKRRACIHDETVAMHFAAYAEDKIGTDDMRMGIYRAYQDADAILALIEGRM